MGESIVNERVAAVETSVSNMEGMISSLAMSIQTLLLQLQQNQQQPPLGNAAELPKSLAPGA
jgi:prefoldin subunit 5